MRGRYFWALTMSETEYYKNPRRGWEEVIARFEASMTDIEEASKCFALHSLQIVEIGLIDLGRVIVATDPQTGWNATTKRLRIYGINSGIFRSKSWEENKIPALAKR